MIWVLGGTHETRALLEMLTAYRDVIVTVATEEGKAFLPEDVRVIVGRIHGADMPEFCRREGVTAIVDMAHPFATALRANVRKVAEALSIPYMRYVRPYADMSGRVVTMADDYEDAVRQVAQSEGTVLFTTGSKRAEDFMAVRGERRFVFRVLPSEESMRLLAACGVPLRDRIGMMGPFSVEMNRVQIAETGAKILVTKDSGEESGTAEKIEACRLEGIRAIVIRRAQEDGERSMAAVADFVAAHRE